jgi:hypothetical protein
MVRIKVIRNGIETFYRSYLVPICALPGSSFEFDAVDPHKEGLPKGFIKVIVKSVTPSVMEELVGPERGELRPVYIVEAE